MMHISPCAWYCFNVPEHPEDWILEEDMERTLIRPPDATCEMELQAARKQGPTQTTDIVDIHEDYLKAEQVQPLRTVCSENTYKVQTVVTRGLDAQRNTQLVCHAYWGHYCTFVCWKGERDGEAHIQAFYDVVSSIQPLALQ